MSEIKDGSDVLKVIKLYAEGEATFDDVKAMMNEVTFYHRQKPELGDDTLYDSSTWEDTVGRSSRLTYAEIKELRALAKFGD